MGREDAVGETSGSEAMGRAGPVASAPGAEAGSSGGRKGHRSSKRGCGSCRRAGGEALEPQRRGQP